MKAVEFFGSSGHNNHTVDSQAAEFLERANRILKQLRSQEFKAVRKPVWLTWLPKGAGPFWKKLFSDPKVEAFWFSPKRLLRISPSLRRSADHKNHIAAMNRIEIIIFNPKAKHLLKATDEEIRELLRHELLHIELQRGHDQEFLNAALEREIFVHTRDILANIEDIDLNRAIDYLEDTSLN